MDDKDVFDVRFNTEGFHFEEDFGVFGLLQPQADPLWRRALLDTGATISIIDLELARKVGAILKGVIGISGIEGTKMFVYMVKVGLHVKHTTPTGETLTYEQAVLMPSLPYLDKSGKREMLQIEMADGLSCYLCPDLLFAGLPIESLRKKAQKDENGHPLMRRVQINYQGTGVPLLIGCDVMQQLENKGFPLDFNFKKVIIQNVVSFPG
jgi:hypothetical protein